MLDHDLDWIIKTLIGQLLLNCVISQQLYEGCGQPDYYCLGSRENIPSINAGGCIKNKNCQVIVKIQKKYNGTSKPEPKTLPNCQSGDLSCRSNPTVGGDPERVKDHHQFEWTLAVEWNADRRSQHYCNAIYLAITKEKLKLDSLELLPEYVPYWSYLKTGRREHFMPKIVVCGIGSTPSTCLKQTASLTFESFKNYIHFTNMITQRPYSDTNVRYTRALGSSTRKLLVEYHSMYRNGTYQVDLIDDRLTVSLMHWHGAQTDRLWTFGNDISKFEPSYLFLKETPSQGSPTIDKISRESSNKKRNKQNLMWLWIGLGIIGLLILLLLCVACFICCYVRRKKSTGKSEEPSPATRTVMIINRPDEKDGKSAILSSSGSTSSSNNSKIKSNIRSKTSSNVNSGNMGTKSDARKSGKNKRLNYIAELAGYTPGRTIEGKKTTSAKEHDFNQQFQSVEENSKAKNQNSGSI